MKSNMNYPLVTEDEEDHRLDAPAFHRNAEPIINALTPRLKDAEGDLLEVGSGSGQHAAMIAQSFPSLTYWPSDPDPAHRASIDAWAKHLNVPSIRAAIDFDATTPGSTQIDSGPAASLRAILCINVIHIAPWPVAEGLFKLSGARLATNGVLALYGPFRFHGRHAAQSNDAFDRSLRIQNPHWGVRDIDDVDALAQAHDLHRVETSALPSNNHMIFYANSLRNKFE